MRSVLATLILDVSDLDQALLFYHEMLGIPIRRQETLDGHRLAYLRGGSTELLLMQQPLDQQNPLLERTGGAVLKFRVMRLDDLVPSLVGIGAQVLRPTEGVAWGERSCLVADLDGYAVLLSEPPSSSD